MRLTYLVATLVSAVSLSAQIEVVSSGSVGIGTAVPGWQVPGFTNLDVRGSSHGGLVTVSSGAADADGLQLGQFAFVDRNTTSGLPAVARIMSVLSGTTANNRGSVMIFSTKKNGGALTDALVIDRDQNVGIGTSVPDYKLDVYGTINAAQTRAGFFLGTGPLVSYGSASGGLYMGFASGGGYIRSVADNGGGAAPMVIQVGNGYDAISISAARSLRFNAYAAGSLSTDSSGNISATSDARAKDTVGDFTTGLAAIRQLQPKKYHWKKSTGLNSADLNVSVYAQDLIAAGIPEAVGTYRTEDEMETVDVTVLFDAEGRELDQKKAIAQEVLKSATTKTLRVTRPKKTAEGETITKQVAASYYTVNDRAVIAALINASKELAAKNDALEARLAKLEAGSSR